MFFLECFMRHLFRAFVVLCLSLGSLGFLGGCVKTGDFWDHKVVLASDLTPSALDGQWEGKRYSYEHYDNGLVHMTIVPADVADAHATTMPAVSSPPKPGTQRYLAKVRMWHYGIFAPEDFTMVLTSTPGVDGQIKFFGERDLGPIDGSCKFDGFVDANKAVMSYVARHDFGSIKLRRVVNAPVARP
jgi:hypothetical protein